MKALLRPAALLLNRLSYPRKLALVGLVLFLPASSPDTAWC